MTNYEYIIASLPDITLDERNGSSLDAEAAMQEILEQSTDHDKALIAFLRNGLDQENLEDREAFYAEALKHPNAFLRRWFSFDLMVRNAKVRYLNTELGRPLEQDKVSIGEREDDPEDLKAIDAIFMGNDLLGRERALDKAYWKVAEEAVLTEVFSIDVVLSFIARLHIVQRWLKLDEQTGREMFHRLVKEVRGDYEGVHFNETNKR